MAGPREPVIDPVSILSLRPTQMTVGLIEVNEKRKRWRNQGSDKQGHALGKHMIPVVRGPRKRLYVVDHHHLARALHDEGVEHVLVSVIADLSMVDREAFWTVMDTHRWMYPYDARGKRRSHKDLPKTVANLKDDPYRSLAGGLRRAGGFAKDVTPFSEFLWADYLRRAVPAKAIADDFDRALALALEAARQPEAVYLPGWCGPSEGP